MNPLLTRDLGEHWTKRNGLNHYWIQPEIVLIRIEKSSEYIAFLTLLFTDPLPFGYQYQLFNIGNRLFSMGTEKEQGDKSTLRPGDYY